MTEAGAGQEDRVQTSSPVDLSNKALLRTLYAAAATLALLLAGSAAARTLNPAMFSPGAPFMQSVAAIGSALLAAGFWAALGKRVGGSAKQGFRRHIWLSVTGMLLVAWHTTASFHKAPMLLLLIIVSLAVLGAIARTRAAVAQGQMFGQRIGRLMRTDGVDRTRLAEVLESKRSVLKRLDPAASEGTFVLRPWHWRTHPLWSWRFARLVAAEQRLLGTPGLFEWSPRSFRLWHQVLATVFIVGLLSHIVLVTWFAGYVADERAIYWWHLAAWDL